MFINIRENSNWMKQYLAVLTSKYLPRMVDINRDSLFTPEILKFYFTEVNHVSLI